MKKDIFIYYLFSFLVGFYLANGTTVLFARVLEFSFQQIFILGGVYMLMFVLFEIPSGALSDLIGRKKTIMAGCLALALAAVATGVSSTFIQVFFSFFIWAIGFSLISGANEALLYDRLESEDLYARVLGKSQFFWLTGTALAGVLGPYLFSLNFRFSYLFSSIPFFLGGIAIAFFDEKILGRKFQMLSHWEQVKEGTKIAFTNRYVRWGMLILALSFGAAYTFGNSYQPYLREIGFSLRAFSVILPVMFIIEALGGSVSGYVRKWLGEKRVFAASIMLIGVSLGLLGLYPVKWILAALLFYTFLQGILRPVISTYSNKHLTRDHRATVISVQNMVGTVTAALMLFLLGYLTDSIGLVMLMSVMGGLVLLFGLGLILTRPKEAV